jgi:cysteinyl-tRNA synthetase
MAWKHLGETFDIHAGGLDLIFPHHENEIAQSRCCFNTPVMANYWLHNGFLQAEGDKMSKSLGNFVTIREALRDWPGEVIRLNMLKTHYRQPIDWTVRGLEETWKTLSSWCARAESGEGDAALAPSVEAALLDDLNTPKAIAELHELERNGDEALLWPTLRALGFDGNVESPKAAEVDRAAVQQRIELRLAARAAKNWAESDRIRDELKGMGVLLKDNKDGTTTWEVAR